MLRTSKTSFRGVPRLGCASLRRRVTLLREQTLGNRRDRRRFRETDRIPKDTTSDISASGCEELEGPCRVEMLDSKYRAVERRSRLPACRGPGLQALPVFIALRGAVRFRRDWMLRVNRTNESVDNANRTV